MSNTSDFIIENNVLMKYVGKEKHVIIPDGVTEIGEKAFWRKNIESVTMPNSVTMIGAGAFMYCFDLQEAVFSVQLTEIRENAFVDCQGLQKICLSDSIKKIGACAFSGCVTLEDAVIPETVEELGENAFSGCPQLRNQGAFFIYKNVLYHYVGELTCVDIPDGVEEVHGLSVYSDKATELMIPQSVKAVSKGAFGLMRSMRKCTLLCETDQQWAEYLVKNVFHFEALVITFLTGNLKSDDTFQKALIKQLSAKKNRTVLVGSFVRKKEAVFLGDLLQYIKKMPLEELEEYIASADDPACRAVLMTYKDKLYSKKDNEAAVAEKQKKELGAKEKSLADYRKEFKFSKKGDRYVISGFKTDVISNAIMEHKEYSDVVIIPAQINGIPVEMGERVFQNCSYIKTVIIENGVEKIGAYSFAGCGELRDVYVPASVTDFGKYGAAFYCEPRQVPFTVHAPAGSDAEKIAEENEIPFAAE